MSNNQPSSNRPQNHQSWQNNPHSSRPMAQRSHTLELTFLQAPAPGQTVVVSPVPGGVHVVAASTCDHGRGRGGGQGDGRGGGRGRGRGDGGQRRIDDMFPVANRIANARGDNSQGALNARSSRDGGDGRGRQSLDADAPRAAWDRRPQRNDNNGGRQSPSGWPDDRRGSPRGMDNDRPSHNRLDEATLSSDPARAARADVANETLKVLSDQAYRIPAGTGYDLRREIQNLARGTKFYSERDLTDWKPRSPIPLDSKTVIEFVEQSTIAAARLCGLQQRNHGKVGVLNFASATKRGGGFKNGAQAQEESLARASTLYLSLSQPDANRFYDTHIKMDHKGYYSHCMIYSPGVTIIRDENDVFVEPCNVNMVTSAAVNAGSVRRKSGRRHPQDVERDIYETMVERMGRILKCFEENGNKVLILGSFGTGVFQNDVGMVASIWAKLLGPGGRFSRSFDHVEFAILGRPTFDQFQKAYNDKINTQFARALSVAEAARP